MKKIIGLILSLVLWACNGIKTEDESKKEQAYVKDVQVEYYPDGKLKLEGNTVNGKAHGVWTYYYENGFIWSEGQFRHGQREGFSKIYFENGKKRMLGQYKEGKRNGWWRVWNSDGSFADSVNLDLPINGEDSLLLGLK